MGEKPMLHKKWLEYAKKIRKGASSLAFYDEDNHIFIDVFQDDCGGYVAQIVHWSDTGYSVAELCRKETWAEAWATTKGIAWGVHFALNESKEVA